MVYFQVIDSKQKKYIELPTDIVYQYMHYCYQYMLTEIKNNNLQDWNQLPFTKIIIQHINRKGKNVFQLTWIHFLSIRAVETK